MLGAKHRALVTGRKVVRYIGHVAPYDHRYCTLIPTVYVYAPLMLLEDVFDLCDEFRFISRVCQ